MPHNTPDPTSSTKPAAPPAPPAPSERDLAILLCSGRDIPCPRCAYNLRDLTSPTCPECGHALTLTITPLRTPRHTAYILTLFSITLSAGCGLPWWIYPPQLSRAIPHWLQNAFVDITWTCFWLALALLVFRRFFLTRPPEVQWLCAILSIALALAVLVIQWYSNILRLFA